MHKQNKSKYLYGRHDEWISQNFSKMVDLRKSQFETLVDTILKNRDKDSEKLWKCLVYSAKIRGFESLAYYFDDG